MHVVAGSSESPFPLNVGLLFFNPAPHRFFSGTQIDVVWFPEGPGASHFTEKEFRGPIHHIIREALDYIAPDDPAVGGARFTPQFGEQRVLPTSCPVSGARGHQASW